MTTEPLYGALNKITDYEYINIWGDKEALEKGGEESNFIIDKSDEKIIGNYTLEAFRNQFYHGPLTPVEPKIIEKGVVIGESNAVLPYNNDNTFGDIFSWTKTDTCYVKNVLLRELKLKIPYLVDGVILKGGSY